MYANVNVNIGCVTTTEPQARQGSNDWKQFEISLKGVVEVLVSLRTPDWVVVVVLSSTTGESQQRFTSSMNSSLESHK